ncbi:hypothetical protein DOT_0238 [Desulfosporosinus sp. OT]|nr:hypothetical protein DOT_0238 [Desulfosporosinus sp. OT]
MNLLFFVDIQHEAIFLSKEKIITTFNHVPMNSPEISMSD